MSSENEVSLAKAIAYMKSNCSDEELSKISLKDWDRLESKLKKYRYDNSYISLEDLDDNDRAMLVALLKKYFFSKEQNEKLDEVFELIDEHHNKGGANNG